jgi:hypothetical protein
MNRPPPGRYQNDIEPQGPISKVRVVGDKEFGRPNDSGLLT